MRSLVSITSKTFCRQRSGVPRKKDNENCAKKLTHVLLLLYRISIHNARTSLYHYTGKYRKLKNEKEPHDALKQKQMHDNHLLRHKLIYG